MKEPFVRFFRENFRPPQRPSAAGAQQPRIAFIDLAKGVCILLVVMMHAGLGHGFPGLRALRMPLYFMLSGLFFKDYGSFRLFVEKKVNKILVPFLFFALLGFADQALTALGEGRALTAYGLWQPFVSPSMTRSNLPVWFLVSLFWANLIYCAVSIHVGRLWLRTLSVFALGGAGYALSQGKVYLPLFFASSLTALPFFFAGSLLRRLPLLYAGRGRRLAPLLGVALVGAGAGFCAWFGTPAIDFRTNFYAGSPLIAFPLSVVLVVGLLLVCKGAGWLPVVSYMGRYSIVVLGLHCVLMAHVRALLGRLTGHAPGAWAVFLSTAAACWLLIPFCRAFLPHVTAQRDWFRLSKK